MQGAHALGKTTLPDSDIFSNMDTKYVWNWHLIKPLMDPAAFPYIIPVICGHVETTFIASVPMMIKSMLNRRRVGTRYWRRGVNSKGDSVMNVITELSLFHPNFIASFCISRGSIPLFWKHTKIDLLDTPPIDYTVVNSDSSKKACRLHLTLLKDEFGSPTFLDLLSKPEAVLSSTVAECISSMASSEYHYFKASPNHLQSRRRFPRFLDLDLQDRIIHQSYFLTSLNGDEELDCKPVSLQAGIFQ